jgi:hypothetical protein
MQNLPTYNFIFVGGKENSYVFETEIGVIYEVKFKPSKYIFESGFSYGYISAVSDSLYKSRIAGFQMCLPKEVELGQLIDVVKIFLDTHPNLLHFTASSLVAKALQDAYPCSQKNSR